MVRRRHANRTHLVERDLDPVPGRLPRRLAACETSSHHDDALRHALPPPFPRLWAFIVSHGEPAVSVRGGDSVAARLPGLAGRTRPAAVRRGAGGGAARPEALAEARGRGLVPPQARGAGLVRRPWAGHGWPPGSGMAGP